MRTARSVLIVLLATASASYAQNRETEETLEERVARLESELAALEMRLASRSTAGMAALGRDPAGLDVMGRVTELERRIDSLGYNVQRMAQQVDAAVREANEARRSAMAAERAARDAMMRAR